MNPVKIVFFGSPDFAGTILEHLVKSEDRYQVLGVVTSPDKPTGRHQQITPSPVALIAGKYDLPVFKPVKLDVANLAHIKLLDADIFLVAAYGKIIPPDWLVAPKMGILNIHFSLLPKYRGALCVSQALLNGDQKTGVTLMVMDEKLDHGPVIAQMELEIEQTDNVETLTQRLTQTSLALLDDKLPDFLTGKLKAKSQDEALAVYTPSHQSRTRASAQVPWEQLKAAMDGIEAVKTHNFIRSFNPDPGAWTEIADLGVGPLKILETKVEDGKLIPITVQRSGKKPIPWSQFETGYLNLESRKN